MEMIWITLRGQRVQVAKKDYIHAKFLDLRESLRNLTEDTVASELDAVMKSSAGDTQITSRHPLVFEMILTDKPSVEKELPTPK